ncbi:hypothetical protein EMIT047CA2_130170 [Pseudomonas soli]
MRNETGHPKNFVLNRNRVYPTQGFNNVIVSGTLAWLAREKFTLKYGWCYLSSDPG